MKLKRPIISLSAVCGLVGLSAVAPAAVMQYGDRDVLGTASYPGDPTAGATLQGLAPNAATFGAPELNHGFPFAPAATDFPGTDRIYVGSVQTGGFDGYSGYSGRFNGPQVIVMDYSSIAPAGQSVLSLTLGIAFDDFQFVPFGQPYTVMINGAPYPALTTLANSLDQTGPQVQFATIGIDLSRLLPSKVLTLSIDQGGNGGDGWAIDFLTIGVEVPAPAAALPTLLLGAAAVRRRRLVN